MYHSLVTSAQHSEVERTCVAQKHFAAERVASLVEDRRIREAEVEAYRTAAVERSSTLCARVNQLEKDLQEATRDYILGEHCGKHGSAGCLKLHSCFSCLCIIFESAMCRPQALSKDISSAILMIG